MKLKRSWMLLAFSIVVMLSSSAVVAQQLYENTYVKVHTVFVNEPLNGAAAADTSGWYRLTGPDIGYGYYSVWLKADEDAGSADFTVTYQLSYDSTAVAAYEDGTSATTTIINDFSGTDWKVYLLAPMPAKYVRFIATAEAGNGADIDCYLTYLRHPL